MPRLLRFLVFITILASSGSTFAQCDQTLFEQSKIELGKHTYLQHFRIKSSKHNPNATSAQFAVQLTKGTTYLISAVNDASLPGKAIIKLYDDFKYFTGNVTSDQRILKGFSFTCNKTGNYYITVKFDNNGPGCAIIFLSMVNKE
ncbi:MAG TPA: hypothetical protein PK990_02745 [Salinivirgaceae bacterium]|nr:hypothetical protein [Salinivirgaceae bacterium]